MMTTMMMMILMLEKRLTLNPAISAWKQNPHATMVVNKYELQNMQHEQSGLPETTFDESIPFLGGFINQDDKPAILQRARDFIKKKFPRVDFGKLGPIGFGKKSGNENTIVSYGTRGGETEIFRKDGKGLLQKI